MHDIWFWQRIVSPHMAHLAVALARLGCQVTYVGACGMSPDRAQQGWVLPELPGVNLVYATSGEDITALICNAQVDSVHICQGIRANGSVSIAQRALAVRGLRQWIIMETVDDSGWSGAFKRFEYGRLLMARRKTLEGVLAIGHHTADWVAARGMPAERVYPFTYFLPDYNAPETGNPRQSGPFRFVFVGQLIPRKRVEWLVNALASFEGQIFELWIVGSGTEESALRLLTAQKLGGRVRWLGVLPLSEVSAVIEQADCLVLPSVHDGWGAVVSEALIVGTPVICSDGCGSAGVVTVSGFGGGFRRDRVDELQMRLEEQLLNGPINTSDRQGLAAWATALGVEAGARYLIDILNYSTNGGTLPTPPWLAGDLCRQQSLIKQ